MAKIKVVKKEKSLAENMSDDYKQMLSDTGACILLKDKPGDYKVMSTYSVKKEKKRETSTKNKKRK